MPSQCKERKMERFEAFRRNVVFCFPVSFVTMEVRPHCIFLCVTMFLPHGKEVKLFFFALRKLGLHGLAIIMVDAGGEPCDGGVHVWIE